MRMPLSLGRRGTLGLASGSYQHWYPRHPARSCPLLGCHSTGLGQPAGRRQEGARPTPWGTHSLLVLGKRKKLPGVAVGGGDRTTSHTPAIEGLGGGPPPAGHPNENTREPPAPQASSYLVHGNPPDHAPSLPAPCSLPWSKPIIMLRVATIISGVCLDNRHSAGQYLPALSLICPQGSPGNQVPSLFSFSRQRT